MYGRENDCLVAARNSVLKAATKLEEIRPARRLVNRLERGLDRRSARRNTRIRSGPNLCRDARGNEESDGDRDEQGTPESKDYFGSFTSRPPGMPSTWCPTATALMREISAGVATLGSTLA